MNKPLCDVLFKSDKRKGVLLLLKDGAQNMETILKSLDTTRQAMLPQIKILEEHYLVSHNKDTYELTAIGKQIVDKMTPLVDTLGVLDTDIDYWGTHNIDFIPPCLMKTMNGFKNCEIINPPITELYAVHKLFQVEEKMPDWVYTVTAFLYPNSYSIFTELLENKVSNYFIVSQELLDKIRAEHYGEYEKLLKNENFRMYVYNKEMNFLFFTFDNNHLLMSLLRSNGEVDSKFILSRNKRTLEWAKELFDHCLENSTQITQI